MLLTSRDNRLIKEGRHLLADSRYRRESGRFLIEGARLCADAALSGASIEAALVTPHAQEAYARQVTAIREALVRSGAGMERYFTITDELARHLADTASPQGVFCLCGKLDNRRSLDTINRMGKYMALEDIQDPANLGAVVRTAEALGVDGLLLSAGCCDITNPKVLRGSMGGVFRLPFYPAGAMADTVASLQEKGMTAWACVVSSEATPVHRAALGPGSVCVVGNEGSGLRPATIAACRERLTIVMPGRAESLNASMAAGIILWELTRPAE